MSVKNTVRKQHARLIDRTREQIEDIDLPRKGWLQTIRKALGMSAAMLAKRAGITRAAIYQAERNEVARGISLRQLDKLAKAMGGRVVYAIIPNESVDDLIRTQATKRATEIIRRASAHMALEDQSLSTARNQEEIEGLTADLLHIMPSTLWNDDLV